MRAAAEEMAAGIGRDRLAGGRGVLAVVADDPGRYDGDLHRYHRPHRHRRDRRTAVDDPFVDEDGGADPIEVTFDEAGTFNLTCKIHPSMNMTVTVEG